ncbi:hypothetical protein HDV00_003996 [Rhizophlyctis rosea]|nr:hypothetical protein HDV00_003996 [Rhizophlyctis rosea]
MDFSDDMYPTGMTEEEAIQFAIRLSLAETKHSQTTRWREMAEEQELKRAQWLSLSNLTTPKLPQNTNSQSGSGESADSDDEDYQLQLEKAIRLSKMESETRSASVSSCTVEPARRDIASIFGCVEETESTMSDGETSPPEDPDQPSEPTTLVQLLDGLKHHLSRGDLDLLKRAIERSTHTQDQKDAIFLAVRGGVRKVEEQVNEAKIQRAKVAVGTSKVGSPAPPPTVRQLLEDLKAVRKSASDFMFHIMNVGSFDKASQNIEILETGERRICYSTRVDFHGQTKHDVGRLLDEKVLPFVGGFTEVELVTGHRKSRDGMGSLKAAVLEHLKKKGLEVGEIKGNPGAVIVRLR